MRTHGINTAHRGRRPPAVSLSGVRLREEVCHRPLRFPIGMSSPSSLVLSARALALGPGREEASRRRLGGRAAEFARRVVQAQHARSLIGGAARCDLPGT
eukprot:scaffold22260_cov63-Phaeocystis_antarctica.AAC.3